MSVLSDDSPQGLPPGPPIIDLTRGVSASTSPAMSLSQRRKRTMTMASDDDNKSSDDSDYDDGGGVGTAPSKTSNEAVHADGPRRSTRTTTRRRRFITEDDDDSDFVIPMDEPCTHGIDSDSEEGAVSSPIIRATASDSSNDQEVDATEDQVHDKKETKPAPNKKERGVSAAAAGTTTTAPPPTKSMQESYLRTLRRNVQSRSFDLNLIEPDLIPTGRTVKKMSAWSGSHWPALREFLQNTIDHLTLLHPKTGRLHPALRLDVEPGKGNEEPLATFRFLCGEEAVCTIVARTDELVIEQLYTFPLPPRALDTGVPDEDKTHSDTAGGFGDGFKTAAVALLALGGKEFRGLEWTFEKRNAGGGVEEKEEEEGRNGKDIGKITWSFEGVTREAVGRYAKCKVLQVQINTSKKKKTKSASTTSKAAANKRPAIVTGEERNYVMTQTIRVLGIGTSFVTQAVPRLCVFWNYDGTTDTLLETSTGDLLGQASSQPSIANGVLGTRIKPEAGVYVRGIYVRPPKISGAIMCFYGKRLQVTGRDRNDVDEDDLVNAVAYVFRKCTNVEYLRSLLAPLKGRGGDMGEGSSSPSITARSTRSGSGSAGGSWLLRSPRFHNRVLEEHRDFILYRILQVPQGSLFVSAKTTSGTSPFLKWASKFLKERGAPLFPIEKGASRYLFEEVSEWDLTERCVRILVKDLKSVKRNGNDKVESSKTAFRKLLSFMGLGRSAKVLLSPDVTVAFVHGSTIVIPEADLTRELVAKVLHVCQSRLDGADGEAYSCLVQALFETLPSGSTRNLTVEDIDKAVVRAKVVRKETSQFMVQSSSSSRPGDAARAPPAVTPPVEDLTGDGEDDSNEASSAPSGGGKQQQQRWTGTTTANLAQQIARVRAGTKKRKQKSGEEDGLSPIISETDFQEDNAGDDTCLRPSSALSRIDVDESLGGGYLLCDAKAATAIQSGTWSESKKARVATLRSILVEAIDVVRRSIPTMTEFLPRIRHGYDASNDTYEAFCDRSQIVVNLNAYMGKLRSASPNVVRPPTLVHDFVVMVTHELAHFLEPKAGHGPVWRDTHMSMLMEVMVMLSSLSSGGGSGGWVSEGGSSSISASSSSGGQASSSGKRQRRG